MDMEGTTSPSSLHGLRDLMARPLTSYYLLLASSGLLLVFGLVMVFSATSVQSYADSGNPYSAVLRQTLYALIGLVAFWVAHRLPVKTYRRFAALFMTVCFVLLAVLDAAALTHRSDPSRIVSLGPLKMDALHFYLGPLQVQPSEIAKLALVLWCAGVLVSLGPRRKTFAQLGRTLFPLAGATLLAVGVNDLGTMLAMLVLVIGAMYAAGAERRVFGYLGVIVLFGILVLVLMHGYRFERITGFLHPLTDCNAQQANNPCYQELEGRYAIANGGWFGVGLGQGHLKWGRLPFGYNDFIFAEIAEELGVFGCLLVLALLATVAYTGLRIARRVEDPFRRIAAAAITAWLVGQSMINISGVIGLLPITGLPLPFISDGGTALVVVLAAMGVLASFARAEPDAARALHARPPRRWARLLWAPLPPLPRSAARADRDEPDTGDVDELVPLRSRRQPVGVQRRT